MKTLLKTKFNWPVFMGACLVIRLLFVNLSWFSFFAIVFSLHQFILLFNSIKYVIPVRYLLGSFMCLQFFIGPVLAYNGLDQYQYRLYKMRLPEYEYFSYAMPAVLSFIIGLHITAGNLKGEYIDRKLINVFLNKNKQLPYVFIALGFFSSILSSFFSSEVAFVFYLLGSFKFIGLFMLILSDQKLKILPLTLVIGSIITTSLSEGMFHDLLTWILFTGAVCAIKYEFPFAVKLTGCIVFILLAVVIQQLKSSYRDSIVYEGKEAGLSTIADTYEQQDKGGSIFSFESLAPSNVRINQGFIITNIMNTVPDRVPFSNGEEMGQIMEAAILPRIIAPNKLTAGNHEVFTKYSGIKLTEGTSMALSSLGDAYLNYGIVGGWIFMFALGFVYSSVLNLFGQQSKKHPVLTLFTCLVFYYPIRPDCELQTILGHLVKSVFLIFMMIYLFRNVYKDHTKVLSVYKLKKNES